MLKSRPEDALVKLVKLVKLWRMMAVSWSFVFWWYPLMCSAQWALLIWKRSILYAVIPSQCPKSLQASLTYCAALISPSFLCITSPSQVPRPIPLGTSIRSHAGNLFGHQLSMKPILSNFSQFSHFIFGNNFQNRTMHPALRIHWN